MITPIYLRDNKDRINYLQYTSRIGRNIFKKKIAAGILASFIMVTLQLICFFSLYSTNNTSMFFNSNINSIYNSIISWYDLTFIQYISLTVMGIYILALVFTLVSMLVSSIGQNYITVIGIQLPTGDTAGMRSWNVSSVSRVSVPRSRSYTAISGCDVTPV